MRYREGGEGLKRGGASGQFRAARHPPLGANPRLVHQFPCSSGSTGRFKPVQCDNIDTGEPLERSTVPPSAVQCSYGRAQSTPQALPHPRNLDRRARCDCDRAVLRNAHPAADGQDAGDIHRRLGGVDAARGVDSDEADSAGAPAATVVRPSRGRAGQGAASSQWESQPRIPAPGTPFGRSASAVGRDTPASGRGLALAHFAGLFIVPLAAEILQHAGLLHLALELLERPVEAVGFIESDFNHWGLERKEDVSDVAADGPNGAGKQRSRADRIGPALQYTGVERERSAQRPSFVTFSAAGPFAPWTRSNSTRSPSASVLKPLPWMAE